MYCLATCVHDHMLTHIRDTKTPKEAWEKLKKIFAANTTPRKFQLKQRVEQDTTKGHVCVRLHHQDQEYM